jgi:Na+-driven multidrug efflux pump
LEDGRLKHWKNAMPANDAIDKQILKLFVPAMLNFLIIPLVGAVDVFWIGRMGSALALAAQGAANQVFSSAFWIISFMPAVIAPVVAKAAASGDTEEVQRAVGEAVFVASFVGLIGMALLTGKGAILVVVTFSTHTLPHPPLSHVYPVRIIAACAPPCAPT